MAKYKPQKVADIALAYGRLCRAWEQLENEKDSDIRSDIATRTVTLYIPRYKKIVPKEIHNKLFPNLEGLEKLAEEIRCGKIGKE